MNNSIIIIQISIFIVSAFLLLSVESRPSGMGNKNEAMEQAVLEMSDEELAHMIFHIGRELEQITQAECLRCFKVFFSPTFFSFSIIQFNSIQLLLFADSNCTERLLSPTGFV